MPSVLQPYVGRNRKRLRRGRARTLPLTAASGEAGDEQGGPCADVGGPAPASRCGPVKRQSVGENSWNSAPRRVRWGQEVAPKAEAYTRSGPVLISQYRA